MMRRDEAAIIVAVPAAAAWSTNAMRRVGRAVVVSIVAARDVAAASVVGPRHPPRLERPRIAVVSRVARVPIRKIVRQVREIIMLNRSRANVLTRKIAPTQDREARREGKHF